MSAYHVDTDAHGDEAIWRTDPERPDAPQPVVYRKHVQDEALWESLVSLTTWPSRWMTGVDA